MKILLIEDNEFLASTLIRRLESRGHAVGHVDSVQGATEYLDTASVDCIVTDREVLDGDAWLFAAQRTERVVFMSGTHPGKAAPEPFFHKGDTSIKQLFSMIEGTDNG